MEPVEISEANFVLMMIAITALSIFKNYNRDTIAVTAFQVMIDVIGNIILCGLMYRYLIGSL